MLPIMHHIIYALISISLTVWVGRVLFTNGRIFIIESFGGNTEMADSVNHLLLVGFYLVNIGFVVLFLNFGKNPNSVLEMIELMSTKLGIVLLILGGMHYFNMKNISKMRTKAKIREKFDPKNTPPSVFA